MAEAPADRNSPALIQPAVIGGEVERITPIERDDSVVALDMSQSSSGSSSNNRPAASPSGDADTCSICLDVLRELAVCDPCFHSFCYPCINAWSRINNICPLCKSTFDKIHHDIKSNHDYKIQNVPPVNRLMTDDIPPVLSLRQTPGDIHVPFMNPSWLFGRRRSTQHPLFTHQETAGPSSSHFFTSSFGDPHSGSVRITTHTPNISISLGGFSSNRPARMEPANMVVPINSASSSDSSLVGRSSTISQSIYDAINSVGAGSSAAVEQSESQSNIPDMLRGIPASDRRRLALQGRRLIYHHGFRVRHYSSSHTRDISLSWMQQRPASITRIMQWANRELSVLVDKRELSSTLGSLMRLLRTVEIGSRPFYTGLVGKLGSRTGHFIHELRSFALSPFAMDEYDRHAMYGPNAEQEKVATEITNEDIERWSLDEIQEVKPISSSTSSPDGATLIRIPSRRSTGDFAPATSSATCARLQSLTPVPLVVLSDDDELTTGNVTLTFGRGANAADEDMVASTSSGRSRSRNGSRPVAIKSARTAQRPFKIPKISRSVLSARVISSDEDDFLESSVDNDVESDFARRIKSVAIDVEDDCNNGSVSRDRSPVRSGKQRMRRRGISSFTSSSANLQSTSSLSQTRRNDSPYITTNDNYTSVKLEQHTDNVPSGGGNILTLGSSSVQQVASQSELTVDSFGDSIQMVTNANNEPGPDSNVVDDAVMISQDVPVEVKEDINEDQSGLISIVKAERGQTNQPAIKAEESNVATSSSPLTKRESISNPSEMVAPSIGPSNWKQELKQATNEGQVSMQVLDSSIREVTRIDPSTSRSSIAPQSSPVMQDGQVASGSQTATTDDILTLTDDLRPKAIVPDLSESAAAEVNVVATNDNPIEVSESEEDAIVFLRQNIFTPPLVDLDSESENEAPVEDDNHRRPMTAQTSTSDIIGQPVRYPLPSHTRSPMFAAAAAGGVAVDDNSDEHNALSRPTAPKLVKYYSSSSSDDERSKRSRAFLNRRLRQKRRRRDAFQHRSTTNKRNAVSSSQPSPEDLSPSKKFRPSQSDGSLDEPDIERPCQPNTSEPAPAEFGRFFSFGEPNFTTSSENSIENPIDLSMEQSRLISGPSSDPTSHPLSGILSYNNVNGYSSDSEGLQDETFSPRARYHPYI